MLGLSTAVVSLAGAAIVAAAVKVVLTSKQGTAPGNPPQFKIRAGLTDQRPLRWDAEKDLPPAYRGHPHSDDLTSK